MSARQKVRRQWIEVYLMSLACKRYKSTSEIETFDSNVKQKVLNDEKRLKNIKV